MNEQFYVAGFKFHEGMLRINNINEGDEVILVHEPEKPYDENAIRVGYDNLDLGYVPRAINQNILPSLEGQSHLIGEVIESNKETAFDEPWKAVKVLVTDEEDEVA